MSARLAPIVVAGRMPWSFSRGLRATLRDQRFTQSDLARLMGVTPAWVSNRMHGIVRWSLLDCTRIADVIEVDLREIMRAGGYQSTAEKRPDAERPASEARELLRGA